MMTEISNLNHKVANGRVHGGEGVPYFAEGLEVDWITTHRGDEYLRVFSYDQRCQSHHDWKKCPEGADGCKQCWNCDSVLIPIEVFTDE